MTTGATHSGNRETASLRKAVRITPAMARAIDHARGDVSWSRWVKRAIETALRDQEGKP